MKVKTLAALVAALSLTAGVVSCEPTVGIDATVKSRHDAQDFELAWPDGWNEVRLEDYLD